jgi:hypothetical protein
MQAHGGGADTAYALEFLPWQGILGKRDNVAFLCEALHVRKLPLEAFSSIRCTLSLQSLLNGCLVLS